MKKSNKIPYTPKYKFGGGFDSKDKANVRNAINNYGVYLGRNTLAAVGAENAIPESSFKGNSADTFAKASSIGTKFTKATSSTALNMAVPGAGTTLTATQNAVGSAIGPDESNLNLDGSSKHQGADQFGNALGQGVGIAGGFMGGMPGMSGGVPPISGEVSPTSGLPINKYGGYMKYAMGGMNMQPNSELENNEMITSNTPPKLFGNGGIELASNNPYGTPTYKTNGPSHENGGMPMNLEPGSIINGKTINPLTKNKFTKDINVLAKMENKYTKNAENGDTYSNTNAKLILPVLAQKKDYLNNLQNAIIANKEQRKALNRGELPQPSMDNEQMEPQGQSEQSEGEYKYGGIHINPANKGKFTASAQRAGMGTQEFANHVLANKEDYSSTQVKRANFAHNAAGWKHKMGGMQPYAMGGVQLPYYNIDRNGNPKYGMGGFNDDPPVNVQGLTQPQYEQAQTDSMTLYKSGLGKKENWNYPGFNDAQLRLTNPKTGETPKSLSGKEVTSTGGINNFKGVQQYQKPSMIPWKEYFPPAPKGGVGILNKTKNDSLHPVYDQYIPGIEKSKQKGIVIQYSNGGKMPKYAKGGEENNELGYTPNNPAEAYRMQQAAKMNNARYSQKSSYSPNVLPWEKINDSENTPNNPYVNSKVNPYDNIEAVNRRNEREAREAAEIAGTESGTPPMNNIDWSKTDKFGNLFNFIGQNAGNIYDLTRKNEPLQKYERAKAKYLDPTQARNDEQYNYRQSLENVRTGSMGSGATLLANTNAARNRASVNTARINSDYENANAQIGNQNNQFNTDIAYREAEARAKDAAMKENVRSQAIHDTAKNFGMMTKSNKQDEIDQKELAMFQWRYKNEPGFKEQVNNFSTKKSKTATT